MVAIKQNEHAYRAPALDKGLDILEFLARSPNNLTQAEIAKGLGRGTNEIYRMLDTLVRRGFVARSFEGDRYGLSLRMLTLADIHPPRRRMLDAAEPHMRAFARDAEQSVQLVVAEDGNIVVASAFSAPGNWRLSLRTGALIGLFNTGSGKVLAAFQTENTRLAMLSAHEPVKGETIMPPDEFEAEAAKIRATGYLSSPSQNVVGAINIAAPVLDPFGNAIAALSCPYLERIDQHDTPDQDRVTKMLRETALEISTLLVGPAEKERNQ